MTDWNSEFIRGAIHEGAEIGKHTGYAQAINDAVSIIADRADLTPQQRFDVGFALAALVPPAGVDAALAECAKPLVRAA